MVLHLVVGGGLIAASAAAALSPAVPGAWAAVGIGAGLAIAVIGGVDLGPWNGASSRLCLALLSVGATIGLVEGGARLVGVDFATAEVRAWRATPPFYRQPIEPLGSIYFRRPGPERWTGQVLHTRLKQLGIRPDPYVDEPAITVEYDAEGFRNPEGMEDWTVAVAGDSFTELGCLAYEDLFTTVIGRSLGVAVKNLGVSYTGPRAHLAYLRAFGIAPGTRHAVVVFFEGNDLADLAAESEALARWRRTGRREVREFVPQPSFLGALVGAFSGDGRGAIEVTGPDLVTATFPTPRGGVPVTLIYTPPGRDGLTDEAVGRLDGVLGELAAIGRERGIAVWMAYMPCKRRVLDGLVAFAPAASEAVRSWRPSDLPSLVADRCEAAGVGFVDLTPALREETERSHELTYNSIYDTHLNARGSRAVGRALARRLAGPIGEAGD